MPENDEPAEVAPAIPRSLTDEQILEIAAREADALDATRVHERKSGTWVATTMFEDSALLRFARAILDATDSKRETPPGHLKTCATLARQSMMLPPAKCDCGFKDDAQAGTLNPAGHETAEGVERAALKDRNTGELWSVPRPGRHHDVIRYMVERGVPPPITHEGYEQGFVMRSGLFVGREEAWDVAERARQLLERAPTGSRGTLYSEDVW